jgi:hypothetical protein
MTILIVTSRGITSCFDGTTNKQFSETVAFPTDNGDYLDARAELTLHKTPSITLSIVAITFNSLLMNKTWQKIIRANRSRSKSERIFKRTSDLPGYRDFVPTVASKLFLKKFIHYILHYNHYSKKSEVGGVHYFCLSSSQDKDDKSLK